MSKEENKTGIMDKVKNNEKLFSVGGVDITTHTVIGLLSGFGLGYLAFKKAND